MDLEQIQLRAVVLAQQQLLVKYEEQLRGQNENMETKSNFSFHDMSATSRKYSNIIDMLLKICEDNKIILQKCEVCGCPEQYLVGYGIPMMDCCRRCYPPIFDTGTYHVMYYEKLYTCDNYKYLGTYATIEDARKVEVPKTGYRCIFYHRNVIEKAFLVCEKL